MKKWETLGKLKDKQSLSLRGKSEKLKVDDLVEILLENRGIKSKKDREEFFKPNSPESISLASLEIKNSEVVKAVNRIKKAKKSGEKVVVYGDYDADGVCATVIIFECLDSSGLDILPYIPERFSEGYGLNLESVEKLKERYPRLGLIITVDNGIIASEAIDAAKKLGINVIVTDHHEKGSKLPQAFAIIHTVKVSGAAVAWILAREVKRKLKVDGGKLKVGDGLDLVAVGTIADQLPLIGLNRSFVKHGLKELNKTNRLGLLALFEEAGLCKGLTLGKAESGIDKGLSLVRKIGTYEVNFIIAPRINAAGRLKHAIDSFRLLCTQSPVEARKLADYLGRTNRERQKVVDEVVNHAKSLAEERYWEGLIVLSHESYHEGVIGLVASKLVEKFYRPAIVISKGKLRAKASARSIPGFNIIEVIRQFDEMLIEGGGHQMAAGFSIEPQKIEEFSKKLEKASIPLLTDKVLSQKLKIDVEVEFDKLNWDLMNVISSFEPTGIGNPTPTFVSKKVSILNARCVGLEGKHLKLTLEQKDKVFDAIAFNFGDYFVKLLPREQIDIVYTLEENVWNDNKMLQLKIKDLRISK